MVLLAVSLALVSGFDLCRLTKSEPATCDIPIIFISERTREADRRTAYVVGASGYVSKPIAREELLVEVTDVLRRQRSPPAWPGRSSDAMPEPRGAIWHTRAVQETVRIGVVGYSGTPFDRKEGRALLIALLDRVVGLHPADEYVLVSGLTDMGIPALAYREAAERGWKTVGIACERAKRHRCYPVDQRILRGKKWGRRVTNLSGQHRRSRQGRRRSPVDPRVRRVFRAQVRITVATSKEASGKILTGGSPGRLRPAGPPGRVRTQDRKQALQ